MPRSRVAPVIVVLMLAGARLYDEADATARQSLSAHYTPADRDAHRYQYVPFEVLPGTERLQLEYQYDKANGGNAVGLGLFEPGSLELGRPRSAAKRQHETIDRDRRARRHARLPGRPHATRPLARPPRPDPRARRRRRRVDHDRNPRRHSTKRTSAPDAPAAPHPGTRRIRLPPLTTSPAGLTRLSHPVRGSSAPSTPTPSIALAR